jgi:protein phosphatase
VAETANERIHEHAQRDASRSGMGTTMTAILVGDDEISIAHVGDSRAYLYRDGELRQLTSDHSLVEELRRQGRLTDEQAEEHPQRSIITRALGPEPKVEVDTMTYQVRPGDVVLLCSDGLTTMLNEQRIAEVLASSADLDAAVSRLIDDANERGGRDNITVVALRLADEGAPVADTQATLVGPTAAEVGLSGDRVAAMASSGDGPERRPPRRWPGRLARAALVLLIVVGVGAAAWYGSRQIYFLGTDDAGRVALYRGLPYDLPFSIELYDEQVTSPVAISALPSDRRDEATNHELRSEDDAQSLLEDLENAAAAPQNPPPSGEPGAGGGGQQGGGKPGGQQGANSKQGTQQKSGGGKPSGQ